MVIATYNRPDILKVAIESVMLQTFSDWKLLVIGDHCNIETENAVTSFNNPRIQYINLPRNTGTQSGPNSVGIALTETEYIAFLNQDDVWLQDHLEHAIEVLEKSKRDFFVGKCGFTRRSFNPENLDSPIFFFVHPDNRTADMSFDKDHLMFESASSWVIKTPHAKKIGYWKHPFEIQRPNLQNWVIRAWRKKTKFVFGEKITVLFIPNWIPKPTQTLYSLNAACHVKILNLLKEKNPNRFREFISTSLENTGEFLDMGCKVLKDYPSIFRKILINGFTKWMCKNIGFDSYEIFYTLMGLKKGRTMNTVTMSRLGRLLPEKVDINWILNELNLNYKSK